MWYAYLLENFTRMATRIKKAKIPRLFVEKLGNSWLLPAFSASTREILSLFSLVSHSCKALIKFQNIDCNQIACQLKENKYLNESGFSLSHDGFRWDFIT